MLIYYYSLLKTIDNGPQRRYGKLLAQINQSAKVGSCTTLS